MSAYRSRFRRPSESGVVRRKKPKKTPERERFDATFESLLLFANAHFASCVYFEPPIEDDEMALRAFRIMLDTWDNETVIREFAEMQPAAFTGVDYELAQSWGSGFVGPMACMKTNGDRAFMLCEGYVFEARSLGRSWDSMVPYAPDMVVTGLLPYEDSIIGSGLLMHHRCHMQGPGVERIRYEFEQGKKRGVISDAESFVEAAKSIKERRRTEGLDPTSYTSFYDYISQMNAKLGYSSFPYYPNVDVRPWTEAEQAFHA